MWESIKDLLTNYFQSESDELLDSKDGYNTNISPSLYRNLQNSLIDIKSKIIVNEKMIEKAKYYINEFKNENEYQYSLNGDETKNVWICKPAAKSRGRGIFLSTSLNEIEKSTRGKESQWICQKYIEHPLIILNHKFDIRQWVLLTDWNPLTIYYYKNCYLRFCSGEYDDDNLNDIYKHLSNNCIQKDKIDGFNESLFKGLMWKIDQFKNYLKEKFGDDTIYDNIIRPQMNNIIIKSLKSCLGLIEERKLTFEMFGYDFMIDE